MAISLNQILNFWTGTTPASSASYTPVATDTTFAIGYDGVGIATALTLASTVGSMTQQTINGGANYDDGFGDLWSLWYQPSQTAVARTHSVTANHAGDSVGGLALDYSGAGAVGAATAVTHALPGTGAGACQGTSWTIPAGSIGIVMLVNLSGSSDTFTATTGSPTMRQPGGSLFFGGKLTLYEYASQTTFTPSFTLANGGVDDYLVMQFMIAPPVTGVKFRKTLPQLGARIGTRQMQL